MSEEGITEAHRAGALLKEEGLHFDSAFTSTLRRAHNTLDIILEELGQGKLPTIKAAALNERDYGQLVGINKEEARKRFGDEQVQVWQRSYDIAPPGGESLKDTAARVCPFFDRWVVPELQEGKNVIVVAHGNSLRSLIMELDKLTPEEVKEYSIATAVAGDLSPQCRRQRGGEARPRRLGRARAARVAQRRGEGRGEVLALRIGEEAREHEPLAVTGEREFRHAADPLVEAEPHPIRIEAPGLRAAVRRAPASPSAPHGSSPPSRRCGARGN